MKWLLSELQRRQVTRVAATYVVASWVLLQVSASLENALTLPSSFDTVVLWLLVVGFPIAMVIAWMFEITPEGIRRTIGLGHSQPVQLHASDWIALGVLASVVLIALLMALSPRVSEFTPSEKSIAILPFENHSQVKDDSDYGDWLSELISGLLGKASGLRVVSQTSASVFKGKAMPLPDIARQLGVALVVEGSVRSEGENTIISAQLINAATDTQVWGAVYERSTENTLFVQSEVAAQVATEVASALKVNINLGERQALNPTVKPRAYENYREALKLYRTSDEMSIRNAQALLTEAVGQDKDFALAWALLSRVHSFLYFNSSDATEGRSAAAKEALDEALRLKPELAEVLLAAAYYEYWVKRDYEGARLRFEGLSKKWPSNADVLIALASITRRQGRWDESKAYFKDAVSHDPLHAGRRLKAAELYFATRDFAGALAQIDAALVHWPKAPDNMAFIAKKAVILQFLGQLDAADALLQNLDPVPDAELIEPVAYQAVLRRNYGSAIAKLSEALKNDQIAGSIGRASIDLNISLGDLNRHAGNTASAKAHYSAALDELRIELARQEKSADIHSYLALAHCGLGERAQAIKHAGRAVELVPLEKDAMSGAYFLDIRARIWARCGDKKAAVTAIEALMKMPAPRPLTPDVLRLDPDFDRLRDNERFKTLVGLSSSSTP